jgi:hypothetical protein
MVVGQQRVAGMQSGSMRRAFLVASAIFGLASVAFTATGCKPKPEDDVVAVYQANEDAIATRNARTLRDNMTPESYDYLKECVSLAQSCPEKEAKALPPSKMGEVIMMRNRIDPQKLRTMTAEDVIAWRLQEGLAYVDADYGILPYRTTITGDTAEIQMGIEVEQRRSGGGFRVGRRGGGLVRLGVAALSSRKKLEPIEGYTLPFRRVNGLWKADEIKTAEREDAMLIAEARQAGMTMPQYIISREEDETDGVAKDIWKPVLKIKK